MVPVKQLRSTRAWECNLLSSDSSSEGLEGPSELGGDGNASTWNSGGNGSSQREFFWGNSGIWPMRDEYVGGKWSWAWLRCPSVRLGDALYNQSLSAFPAPGMSPGRPWERGLIPIPTALPGPAPEHPKPGVLGARSRARSRAVTGRARGQGWLMRDTPGEADKLPGMRICAPLGGRPAGGHVSGRGWEGEEPLEKGQRCPRRGCGGAGGAGQMHFPAGGS